MIKKKWIKLKKILRKFKTIEYEIEESDDENLKEKDNKEIIKIKKF